jgi:hypothetical protein
MKIETKYNIGDEVWFASRLHYIKGVISDIIINAYNNKTMIVYGVEYKNYVGYSQKEESELFPTKEELLKSL